MSDAYELGFDSFLRGDEADMNPFDSADAQYDQWHEGFCDAANNHYHPEGGIV